MSIGGRGGRTHVLDELAADAAGSDDEDAGVADLVEEVGAEDGLCVLVATRAGRGGHLGRASELEGGAQAQRVTRGGSRR